MNHYFESIVNIVAIGIHIIIIRVIIRGEYE